MSVHRVSGAAQIPATGHAPGILETLLQKIATYVKALFEALATLFRALFCCTPSEMPPAPLPLTCQAQDPAAPPEDTTESSLDISFDLNRSLQEIPLEIPILDIYRGEAALNSRVTLEAFCALDDETLESQDDAFDELFPIDPLNLRYPILRACIMEDVLRQNVRRVLERILSFYGFRYIDEFQIRPAENCRERYATWLTPENHNFQRITRILTSLKFMGFQQEARQFFEMLGVLFIEFESTIGEETRRKWSRAARDMISYDLYPRELGENGLIS